MNIPIYSGSSDFSQSLYLYTLQPNVYPSPTPFGFYDNDVQFQNDANSVTNFCARRLGWPIENVELQDLNFWTAFEMAVTVYGNEVYQFQIRENMLSMEGNPTGSGPYNQLLMSPSLGGVVRISENYGEEAGVGGNVTWYSGAIRLYALTQSYDLNLWAQQSASLGPNDYIEVKRIFFEAPPAALRYFDPYVGIGYSYESLLNSFGFGAYSPAITFMLMPLFFDLQRIQAIELNDQIRKAAFSFEIINNQLKIFPIPLIDYNLWIQYVKGSERDSVVGGRTASGSAATNLITNPSNVPYVNPNYNYINSVGRMWVYQYTLALCREILGYVRGKYQTVPIPGAEVSLNQQDLLTDARSTKEALLLQLRDTLSTTGRQTQLEKQAANAENLNKTLANVPMGFYIF
jgi:hypothetical protein